VHLFPTHARVRATAYVSGVVLAALSLYAAPARAGEGYEHDGFQFRGAVGFGYLSASGSDNDSGSIHGGDGNLELYFGGMPIRGLAIGGFISDAYAPSPGITSGNVTVSDSNTSLNFLTIGPYIDWYPHPHEGLHILGTVGYANLKESFDDGNVSASQSAGGFTIGAGIGYDWWVSRDFSLGILGRFTYAHTSESTSVVVGNAVVDTTVTVSQDTVAPEILFSFSYN
jgi:hypothetical protein